MKKIFTVILQIALLTAIAQNVSASDKNANMIFAGFSAGEDNNYGFVGAVHAVNGDINKDGVLLRVSAGQGKYNYATVASTTNSVDGTITSSDLMLGYQDYFSKGHVTLYLGGNYDNYYLSPDDVNNHVIGGKAGAKGQLEFAYDVAKDVALNHITSYSTAFHSYWTRTDIALDCGHFAVGPEFIFLGNDAFNQQRQGLAITKMNFTYFEAAISGGYMKSSGKAGDDGYYATIFLAKKF